MAHSRLPERAALAMGLLACLACSASLPDQDEPLLLLNVISVRQGEIGPYDKELCQVSMDVEVWMPDCGIWSHTDHRREGNTFHFAMFSGYSQSACLGRGTYRDGTSICLPGIRANPPPPPLPSGTYYLVVNGVTGSFTIQ